MSIEEKKCIKYILLGVFSLLIATFIKNDIIALGFYVLALIWLFLE